MLIPRLAWLFHSQPNPHKYFSPHGGQAEHDDTILNLECLHAWHKHHFTVKNDEEVVLPVRLYESDAPVRFSRTGPQLHRLWHLRLVYGSKEDENLSRYGNLILSKNFELLLVPRHVVSTGFRQIVFACTPPA